MKNLIYVVLFIVGLSLGFYIGSSNKVKPESNKNVKTVYKTLIDTFYLPGKEFAVTSAAKLGTKVPSSTMSSPSVNGGDTLKPWNEVEYVYWDTATQDFNAHVEYWFGDNTFRNKYTPFNKVIVKDNFITNTITETVTKTEHPKYEIGIGAKGIYQDSKFSYMPFAAFTVNNKILFINLLFELRGYASFTNGNVSMIPEVQTKILIGL